jgi:hypothetical protein
MLRHSEGILMENGLTIAMLRNNGMYVYYSYTL